MDAHYVGEYKRHVDELLKRYPLEVAMQLAVGGGDTVGEIELGILRALGLNSSMDLVDVGCGSGRLSRAVGHFGVSSYLGTDVVPELIAYAQRTAPSSWHFEVVSDLVIPSPDESADMVALFSVITHLLHEESYLLCREASRVLRPGGLLVVSFLEFACPTHWAVFEAAVLSHRSGAPMTTFADRSMFEQWAPSLGLELHSITRGDMAFADDVRPLGQSVVVFRRSLIDS